jgi:uncharacterized protein (DUF1330 family)
MPAYVIAEVEATRPDLIAEYRELARAAIAEFGGRYLVRNEVPEGLEGEWPPGKRLVVLEFPSAETAREWYRSPGYARALEISRTAMVRRVAIVDGGIG